MGWVSTRTPGELKGKRAEMAYEHVQLAQRRAQLDVEVDALDYALRVLDPDWESPRRISKPKRQTLLPCGAVAQSCLQYLRQHETLWTPELAKLIAGRYRLSFQDKRAEQDFASGVATSLPLRAGSVVKYAGVRATPNLRESRRRRYRLDARRPHTPKCVPLPFGRGAAGRRAHPLASRAYRVP